MSPSVIKSMAAFVYLAVLKDIFVGRVKYGFYKQGKDLKKGRLNDFGVSWAPTNTRKGLFGIFQTFESSFQ